MMQSKSQANPLVYFLFLALLFTTVGCDKLLATQFPATEFYQGPQLLLAQAIERGDLAAVQRLAPQTDMKTLGNKGMTMLHFALAHAKETYNQPQLDIITALMRAGADYRQASPPPPENDTPLNLALFLSPKYPLILKAMLEGGLPPNSPIRPEWPDSRIIEELIFDEDLEALKMLVAYGADVNH